MRSSAILTLATLGSIASSYELPAKLKSLYDKHQSGPCSNKLSDTFKGGASYCGDIPNAIFLKGNGTYDNMDIDCDGVNRSAGACANDQTGQDQTAFMDTVKTYGIPDLDANVHPYVVFGNAEAVPSFVPQDHGIKPLSVMAVICNDQVHYGIWGDVNGGVLTGEASLSMAKLCFPSEPLSGDNGHDAKDVMYIAFTGNDTVPGKDGANWSANNTGDFAKSIKCLGDKLVDRLALHTITNGGDGASAAQNCTASLPGKALAFCDGLNFLHQNMQDNLEVAGSFWDPFGKMQLSPLTIQ